MNKSILSGFLTFIITFAIGAIAWAQQGTSGTAEGIKGSEVKTSGTSTLDEEGCSDYPLFARMNGFYIESCKRNFDGIEVSVSEDDSRIMEGAHTQIQYVLDEANGRLAPSLMQVTRTYEQLASKLGGRKIYADDFGYICFTAKKDATELWVIVRAIGRSAVTAITLDILEVGILEKKAPDNLHVATGDDRQIESSGTASAVAQETIPPTPKIPSKIGGPSTPGVTAPASTPRLVIEHLSPAADAEVLLSIQYMRRLEESGENNGAAGMLYGLLHDKLPEYEFLVSKKLVECMNHTFTAAENLSAGCTEGESPASCERKLLNWFMLSDGALKNRRDLLMRDLNHWLLKLQDEMQRCVPEVYPK